jgi:hypothetical protein
MNSLEFKLTNSYRAEAKRAREQAAKLHASVLREAFE